MHMKWNQLLKHHMLHSYSCPKLYFTWTPREMLYPFGSTHGWGLFLSIKVLFFSLNDMPSKNASQLSRPVITSLLKWRLSLPVPYIVNKTLWYWRQGIFIIIISKGFECSYQSTAIRIPLQSFLLPMLVTIQKDDRLDPTSSAFRCHHCLTSFQFPVCSHFGWAHRCPNSALTELHC